ncbi:MAG: hypothetical protein NTW03_11890 [Verrucomicrobia bacterium]|nr:hypothetical protein [Verrucomicrobiota bacterium]
MTPNEDVGKVGEEKRLWLTAEEFLAQVEAHRAARLKEGHLPRKPWEPGPAAREYRRLNPNLQYTPKRKGASAPKPEVTA